MRLGHDSVMEVLMAMIAMMGVVMMMVMMAMMGDEFDALILSLKLFSAAAFHLGAIAVLLLCKAAVPRRVAMQARTTQLGFILF